MVEEARANAQAEVEAAKAAVHRVEAALEEQMQYLSMAEKEVCTLTSLKFKGSFRCVLVLIESG